MGIFGFSQWFFFCNYKVSLGAISYLTKYKKKRVCVCGAPEGEWDTLVPIGWCLRCLPTSKKYTLSPYRWKCHCFLFLLMQRVSPMMVWFGIGGLFLFSPSSLMSLKNYSLTLLVFGISTSVLILLMSNFWSWSFCISFIYF